MRRRLLNVLTAVPLLLCVAVVALWVRSFWVFDRVSGTFADGRFWGLYSVRGELAFRESKPWPERRRVRWAVARPGDMVPRDHISPDMPPLVLRPDAASVMFADTYPVPAGLYDGPRGRDVRWRWWRIHGYYGPAIFRKQVSRPIIPDGDTRVVHLPHWIIAGVCALTIIPRLAGGFWRRWRARRGRAAGLCHFCGYDLRATPGRCPECGAAPVEAPT